MVQILIIAEIKKKFKLSDDDSDIENDNDSDDAINRLVRQQDKDQAHLAHGLKNLLINDDDDYLETRTNSARSGANLFIGNSKELLVFTTRTSQY